MINTTNQVIAKLQRYEKILWYRYYQLYVVGYSKDIKPDKSSKASQSKDDRRYYCLGRCKDESKDCCINCYHGFRDLSYAFLVLLKYIAQGTTVPLLMLQMFDTYALLCFSPDGTYCKTVSEYKVHLAQAAITISFYLCIALAQLTSAMLDWYDQSSGQKNDNPATARDDQSSGQKNDNPSTTRDDQSSGQRNDNPSTVI